jgi:septum site-determining protein MinD
MYYADRAIVVVNPEVSSVRDSDRILGLLSSKTARAEKGEGKVQEHLLLTRYNPRRVAIGEMMSVEDVKEILGLDVIGVIPESPDVLSASNAGTPVILNDGSDVAEAYNDAVGRLLGDTLPLRFIEEPKKGFFARMFGS